MLERRSGTVVSGSVFGTSLPTAHLPVVSKCCQLALSIAPLLLRIYCLLGPLERIDLPYLAGLSLQDHFYKCELRFQSCGDSSQRFEFP